MATALEMKQEWIPKAEAAQMLGVSTREIERKAAAGRIQMKKVRLPGDKTDRAVYLTDDIDRVKQEREAGAMQLTVAQGHALPSAVPAWLAAVLQPRTEPINKAWLTLDEAAAYSGLPAPEISRLVRGLNVHAIGHGHKTWRIQRESLDEWGRMVHVHQIPKEIGSRR